MAGESERPSTDRLRDAAQVLAEVLGSEELTGTQCREVWNVKDLLYRTMNDTDEREWAREHGTA